MARARAGPSLADYVAVAISPALIMALVISLVYFLLEILYAGQFAARLHWIFFWFVFAAVLLARVSMIQALSGRAGLYGVALGVVVFLALQYLVEYPAGSLWAQLGWLVNAGLIAIIWWSAHRLTWDCTFIEEQVDSSGVGLLEAAALEVGGRPDTDEGGTSEGRKENHQHRGFRDGGLMAWWERYRRYCEERERRPRSPGIWVVYFSLAALPLFGLGQSLIPPGDVARRRYAFWLMAVYLASGLGLLLTTAFLGLRRYLRQRKLKMPDSMVRVWLSVGVLLVAVLLAAGAFLPRPNAEYRWINLGPLAGNRVREASRFAFLRDGAAKGAGKPGSSPAGRGKSGAGSGNRRGQPSAGTGGKQVAQDASQGNAGRGSDSSRSGSGQKSESGGRNSSQANTDGGKGQGAREDRGGTGQNPDDSGGGRDRGDNEQDTSHGDQSADDSEASGPTPTPPGSLPLVNLLGGAFEWLKWIVFGILALIVGFVVLRALLGWLSQFTGWARSLLAALQGLWQALFGWARPAGRVEDRPIPAQRPQPPPRPFASFHNPFLTGGGGYRSVEDLVHYSFDALEALARERRLPRRYDETPLEFGSRLAGELPSLGVSSRRLASLYARVAYARGGLPNSCLSHLREFWDALDAEKSTSAMVDGLSNR